MKAPPKNIFRCRRPRPGSLVIGPDPTAPYLAEAIKAGLKQTPGTLSIAEVWHDPSCRQPQGGACTFKPDVEIRPFLKPERN
jgi:hypothetical protein